MQNDENAVIRYLMKEMDPSEEVRMERTMMEDDNLLIEVESMRQTLQRLDGLPDKEPPADLSASIRRQAEEQKKSSVRWPQISADTYKYAAVLLIGVLLGSGTLFLFGDSGVQSAEIPSAAAPSSGVLNRSALEGNAEPWVDREDVIYYQDMFNRQSGDYNAIMETSTEKLKPVEGTINTRPNSRNVQLTGGRN